MSVGIMYYVYSCIYLLELPWVTPTLWNACVHDMNHPEHLQSLHVALSNLSCLVSTACARYADKPGYPQILLKAISAKSYVWPTSYKYLHSATNEKWALTKNLHNYIHPFCRYGFDYGSVHFVLMSTEHNFTQGSPQYKFLDQHMQGVDRSKTPWLIFAGHRLGGTLPQGVITLRIAC